MSMDAMDFSMDAAKRHLYTNDCYHKLELVQMADIEKITIDPEDTLKYVIQKYNLEEIFGKICCE